MLFLSEDHDPGRLQILADLSIQQKKSFLRRVLTCIEHRTSVVVSCRFFSGSDRAPIGGLSELTMVVQRASPDSDHLPTSHTCFNILMLPEYTSKAKLKALLTIAIENSEGFGLE